MNFDLAAGGFSSGFSLLLFGLLLVFVAYLSYRRTTPPIPGNLRIFLASLRVLAFLLVVLLFLDPRVTLRRISKESGLVVALIDKSESMSLPCEGWESGGAPSRFEEALRMSEELESSIRSKGGMFKRVFFSSDLLPAAGNKTEPDGQGTNISRSLESLCRKLGGENLSAFFLFSDGLDTESRLLRGALPPVAVFTVGLGDTSRPEDVRIEDVDYNTVVRSPSKSPITVTVVSSGESERAVRLELSEGGETLFSKELRLGGRKSEVVEEIKLDFPKPGRRRFLIELDVAGFDAEEANNQREVVIEAEKAEARILIVDMSPGWELHFLTDFLSGEKTFDFRLICAANERIGSQGGLFLPAQSFDASLGDYDAIVLSSLSGEFLTAQRAVSIRNFVEGGGGLLVLPGPGSLFEESRGWMLLQDLLPADGTPPFHFYFEYTTVLPGSHAALNPITAELVPLLGQTDWQERNPLLGYYAPLVGRAGSQVLLETKQGRSPALVYHRVGGGRVALVSAGPLWRWKFLPESNPVYGELLSRLLDVLSRGEGTEKFVLKARKNVYDSGETPVFYSELFDKRMQPVTGAPVRLEVSRVVEGGRESPFRLVPMAREGVQSTRFKAVLSPLPPGRYRVRGEATLHDRSLRSPAVEVEISRVSVEYQKVHQDRARLLAIARRTGGSYADRATFEKVLDGVKLKDREREVVSGLTLRASALVFAFLLFLLSLEWAVRKRAGMI